MTEQPTRYTIKDMFARENRMVNTDWGPEPFEPVAIEIEPFSGLEPGDELVSASAYEALEYELAELKGDYKQLQGKIVELRKAKFDPVRAELTKAVEALTAERDRLDDEAERLGLAKEEYRKEAEELRAERDALKEERDRFYAALMEVENIHSGDHLAFRSIAMLALKRPTVEDYMKQLSDNDRAQIASYERRHTAREHMDFQFQYERASAAEARVKELEGAIKQFFNVDKGNAYVTAHEQNLLDAWKKRA